MRRVGRRDCGIIWSNNRIHGTSSRREAIARDREPARAATEGRIRRIERAKNLADTGLEPQARIRYSRSRLDPSRRCHGPPRRHSGRRQGHADEVRAAQGAAQVAGRPLIDRVLDTADALIPRRRPRSWWATGGCGAGALRRAARRPVRGAGAAAGHRARAAADRARAARHDTGTVVLLSGDVPLLTAPSRCRAWSRRTRGRAAATVLTAVVERPYGYGRIVRSQGRITRIVEERDASPAQRADPARSIPASTPSRSSRSSTRSRRSARDNAQGEYYLPDLIAIYRRRRRVVATYTIARRRRDSRHQQPIGACRGQSAWCDSRRTKS